MIKEPGFKFKLLAHLTFNIGAQERGLKISMFWLVGQHSASVARF